MKRFLALALIIGSTSSLGLVGCDQKTEVKKEETVTTPTGKEKITTTTEDKKSGDAKEPAPATTPPAEAPK